MAWTRRLVAPVRFHRFTVLLLWLTVSLGSPSDNQVSLPGETLRSMSCQQQMLRHTLLVTSAICLVDLPDCHASFQNTMFSRPYVRLFSRTLEPIAFQACRFSLLQNQIVITCHLNISLTSERTSFKTSQLDNLQLWGLRPGRDLARRSIPHLSDTERGIPAPRPRTWSRNRRQARSRITQTEVQQQNWELIEVMGIFVDVIKDILPLATVLFMPRHSKHRIAIWYIAAARLAAHEPQEPCKAKKRWRFQTNYKANQRRYAIVHVR